MKPDALKALKAFDDDLTDIIVHHLLGVVTPEEVNETYSHFNKRPIADRLQELINENTKQEAAEQERT